MFERFTKRSRRVMKLPNRAARRRGDGWIDTEHILLGLIDEGAGDGVAVLTNLGVDLQSVLLDVEGLLRSQADMLVLGKLPQTQLAKAAILHAIEEARDLGRKDVGTAHLLVGLMREGHGAAAQVLMRAGLTLQDVREEARRLARASMRGGAFGDVGARGPAARATGCSRFHGLAACHIGSGPRRHRREASRDMSAE